jgi:N-acetylglucosaminyldiphosphoundecaprenol N-acetyl-beta-D-mannosaminyltransferase
VSPQSHSLCGIRLDTLTKRDLLRSIEAALKRKQKLLVLNHNLHSLYLYQTDPLFREAYRAADHVYVDGMPVIWLARAAGLPAKAEHRLTLLDSFHDLLAASVTNGWRVFYLGSKESTLQAALTLLRERHPRLVIAGRNGYLGPSLESAEQAVSEINRFQPDLLFVGMGMPLQEAFLRRYLAELQVRVALTSGATLDYVAGTAYKPPAWAGPLGLYGVFRLCSDPKRLWRRYLWEPLVLLGRLGPQVVAQRTRTLRRRAAAPNM